MSAVLGDRPAADLLERLLRDDPSHATAHLTTFARAAAKRPAGPSEVRRLAGVVVDAVGVESLWGAWIEPHLEAVYEASGSAAGWIEEASREAAWRRFVAARGERTAWEVLLRYDPTRQAAVRLWRQLEWADRGAQAAQLIRAVVRQEHWAALMSLAEGEPLLWSQHAASVLDGVLNLMDTMVSRELGRWRGLLRALQERGGGWIHLARLQGIWTRIMLAAGGEGADAVWCGALDEAAELEEAARIMGSCFVALEAPDIEAQDRDAVLRAIRRRFVPATSRLLYRLQAYDDFVPRFRSLFEQYGLDTSGYL